MAQKSGAGQVEATRCHLWDGFVTQHLIHPRVFSHLSLNARVGFDNLSISEIWVTNARYHAMWSAGFFRFCGAVTKVREFQPASNQFAEPLPIVDLTSAIIDI